jgi:hypothetical protein
MKKCKSCYLRDSKPCYECSACVRGDDHYKYYPTTHTNADRIRRMTDEELAEFLSHHVCYSGMADKVFTLRWLRQPLKEE